MISTNDSGLILKQIIFTCKGWKKKCKQQIKLKFNIHVLYSPENKPSPSLTSQALA